MQISKGNVTAKLNKKEHLPIYIFAIGRQFGKRSVPTFTTVANHGTDFVDRLLDRHTLLLEERDQIMVNT